MENDTANSDVAIIEEFFDESFDYDAWYDESDEEAHNDTTSIIDGESAAVAESEEIVFSPGGTKYWTPKASYESNIAVGVEFASVEEADSAYRKYADDVGFDVRQSNMKKNKYGIVTTRYLLCSRQGIPTKQDFDTLNVRVGEHKVRNSNLKRTGCKACIKYHYRKADARYVVYKFEQKHNHSLYNGNDKKFSRGRRQLKYTDYRNIYNASGVSIGGARSHTIQASLKGGFQYVGATPSDYKNARRDMIKYVGNKDAQMIINLLTKRKASAPDYFFEYMVKDGELQAIFWADEISRLNYKEFGDTISFDATYRTNRHAMNFVPFIAIDNHKRSVVVGSALISHEDVENFTWVLTAFLKAHTNQPKFVITDQCPSMKQAIPVVFTESKHRLCTWHIMKKIPKKVGPTVNANATFKKRINRLVWSSHISVDEFEGEWKNVINEYGLEGDEWFADKYAIRDQWISAFFKDDAMSGLMRTTSRSESSHAYFRLFASFKNDFVRFLRAFDGAIEKQRNKHSCLEFVNRNTFPRCKTPLGIELHASEVYTRSIFFDVQKEIVKAIFFCALEFHGEDNGEKRYTVLHKNSRHITKVSYEVVQDVSGETYECRCNFFLRHGMLCRHIFKVLLNDGIDSIPQQFISRRWTRALVPVQITAARARYGEIDVEKESLINGLHADIDLLVSRTRNDKRKLREISECVAELKTKYGVDNYVPNPAVDKAEAIKECYGVDAPVNPEVLPAAGICNKGSGTGKRLMGALEKAVIKNKRPKRKCKLCNEMAHHDSRNCPSRNG